MKNLTKSMVKVLSLYFFFTGLSTLVTILSSALIQKGAPLENYLATATFPLAYICIGAILWCFSGSVASIIVGKNANKPINEEVTTQSEVKFESFNFNMLLTALIIAVGFILCGEAIPKLTGAIFSLIFNQNPDATAYIVQERVIMIESLIKTIIGILLVFGAREIGMFVSKLRTFGIDDNQNS